MATSNDQSSSDSGQFDALAAVAEKSELDVLPSLITTDEVESEPDTGLITAQDLAHLTGESGPQVNGWDSPAPPKPAAPAESKDGIDAPVSKAIVFPLIGVAIAVVIFAAYSILTASPAVRPDTVALIDRPTTTAATTTTEVLDPQPGPVGVDIAEQAAWICAGEQFSIARAPEPSLATYNDLIVATRDGRDDWSAPADHVTMIDRVPSLVGCLTTADAGEISRCLDTDPILSRRSVDWTYRVLRSSDGFILGQDQGTANEVPSCEELQAEGVDRNAVWSTLPQDRIDQVALEFTSAPHPEVACSASTAEEQAAAEPILFEQGAAAQAMFDGVTNVEIALPVGWQATDDRPVEVVFCLENVGAEAEVADGPGGDKTPPATAPSEEAIARVHAMHRDGQVIGSWDYVGSTSSESMIPPDDWWLSVVGPSIGYVPEDSEADGS